MKFSSFTEKLCVQILYFVLRNVNSFAHIIFLGGHSGRKICGGLFDKLGAFKLIINVFRSCNKTRFILRIWLRFDTVNKLMWLCKNRTCEFKAYKVQLSAQSELRKLSLPGQSICIQMKVWSVGPSDQS